MAVSVFWFRRDLRIIDNTGLYHALKGNDKVIPLFIFDTNILQSLPKNDTRVSFFYSELKKINIKLKKYNSSILCIHGDPLEVWERITKKYKVSAVYTNSDYEPYALKRDTKIREFLKGKNIIFKSFKDQVLFEKNEVLKDDGKPYTVFTPYKNKWLKLIEENQVEILNPDYSNFLQEKHAFPSLESKGFTPSSIQVPDFNFKVVTDYDKTRDFPTFETSNLGPHLRFGTVSIRTIYNELKEKNQTFISELIWREFFMQILFHFPFVVDGNFRKKYDGIQWQNSEEEFEKWCKGETGYPLVDAGMRQLNQTGYMHNRVRMVTASFLCKHLLIDWRWGESYFAEKLIDYELSSNNGNWQWVAGTGCDAAPYFRIFNPTEQQKKYDKNLEYVKEWVPEFNTPGYPSPIVEHSFARQRAITTYKKGLK